MKLSYTTANSRLTVELEADTHRELFAQISRFQEVFEETKCGKCGSENLKFVVRTVDEMNTLNFAVWTAVLNWHLDL